MTKNKIIFVAQDPGGFEAILPVIKNLQKKNSFALATFLCNESRNVAKRAGIKYIDVTGFSFSKIRKRIKKEKPALLFTATSGGFSIDKKIVKMAKSEKIATASIVDYWSNYKKRFGESLEYLSDYVLAVDEKMEKDMVEGGVPENKIFVVGNPRFDHFSFFKKPKVIHENTIVFYSQPFSEQAEKDFDEVGIFSDIINVLQKDHPGKKIIIKFHPREKKYDKFNKIIKRSKLKIKKEKTAQAEVLSKSAGLVLGIDSVALFDAALMGKKVLSYQPGKNIGSDRLQSNVFGWSVPVYRKEDLAGAIRNILGDKIPVGEKNRSEYTQNNSTQKVINFIKKHI